MRHSPLTFNQSLQEILPEAFSLPALTIFALFCCLSLFFFSIVLVYLFLREKKENRQLRQEMNRSRAEIHEQEIRNTRLTSKLESDQQLFTEKLTLLQDARDELKLQFSQLAGQIFDDSSKKFSTVHSEKLSDLLTPFNRELAGLRQEMNSIYNKDSRERFALKQEISQLQEINRHLGDEANNLTQSLKGDNKTLGNWGELVLERLLETSGLRKGIEFSTQGGYRDSNNQLLKPDVIIHLPDNHDIVIDAKTSLLSWSRYLGTEEEGERQQALKALVTSLRTHFTGLGTKNYPSAQGLHSLDFVLMFIPIEAAFATACRHDPTLLEDALSHNVILASPTTLLTTLRAVQNIWRFEQQEKNAQEIARRAGLLYDKFRSFLEELEKLGRQINTAQSSYNNVINKLSQGQGNIISQAIQLKELGVQPKRDLPETIIKQAELFPEKN